MLHLPQATGIWIGRAFGLFPIGLLYAGRLVNLMVFTTLITFALRLIPFAKLTVLLLATMPMSLFLAASLSHDATVIGSCFLWIAMVLRFAQSGSVLKPPQLASLLVFAPVIGCTKLPYTVPLLLLFFLIPASCFGARAARWLWFGSIAAVAGGLSWGWARAIAEYQFAYTGYNPAYWITTTISKGVNPTAQIQLILSDPGNFVLVIARSLLFFGWSYFRAFVGVLGWLDAPVPTQVIVGYAVALLLAVGLDVAPLKPFSFKPRALCLGAWLASVFGLSIIVYIAAAPVGCASLWGFQGRYLLPVAPLLSLAFYRGILETTGDPRGRAWITRGFVAWIVFSLLTTVWSLTCRYWVGSST